jgi:hypothetical protein
MPSTSKKVTAVCGKEDDYCVCLTVSADKALDASKRGSGKPQPQSTTNLVAGSKREALDGRAATLLTNDIDERSQKMAWQPKKTMADLAISIDLTKMNSTTAPCEDAPRTRWHPACFAGLHTESVVWSAVTCGVLHAS